MTKCNSLFVCYGDGAFVEARDQLASDAEALGIFDDVEIWDRNRLMNTDEYEGLDSRIKGHLGSMYFWWKPFIIRKALERIDDGGYVFYSDSGRYDGGFRLGRGVEYLVNSFRSSGFAGVLVPQFGSNRRWIHRECAEYFECNKDTLGAPQIQATFSMWVKNSNTMTALHEWEICCRNFNLIADAIGSEMGNQCDDFRAHRHDQSILTLVALKYELHYLKLGNRLARLILGRLSSMKEANVEFKKTEFVAKSYKSGRIIIPLLSKYIQRKIQIHES
jgi:hypothetical protein